MLKLIPFLFKHSFFIKSLKNRRKVCKAFNAIFEYEDIFLEEFYFFISKTYIIFNFCMEVQKRNNEIRVVTTSPTNTLSFFSVPPLL